MLILSISIEHFQNQDIFVLVAKEKCYYRFLLHKLKCLKYDLICFDVIRINVYVKAHM